MRRAEALGETWVTWRLLAAGVIALAVIGVVVIFASEFMAIRRAGGIKAYVGQSFDAVSYGTIRGIWTGEVIVGVVTVAVLLHAFVPKLVSELQIEAVVAVFTFAGAMRGINFGAFWAKRATEDAAITATRAAVDHPDVMPVVTTNKKTGDTTVSVVAMPASLQPQSTTTTEETKSLDGASISTKTTTTGPTVVDPAPPSISPGLLASHAARDD